jgi:pimeloyl-ACP methyl ester carboxylesterase
VAPHSIGNSAKTADNVYVIVHGWMPGYQGWVDKLLGGALPVSWQTWQGPVKAGAGPSTTWLYQGSNADAVDTDFPINETGLAQEIKKVDPHATVLAYSWIDDSATATKADFPVHGYKSEAYTTLNGMRMAEAIMQALAPNYYKGLGKVHLIGHSHGARVATVAALTLQKAAAKNPQFDVVRQLTLLDSPENNTTAIENPVKIDAANFDWSYLAQLNVTPPAIAKTGTVVHVGNHQTTMTVSNLTGLKRQMGVTGPGVPAGTTISSFGSGNQIVLSAAVTDKSGASIPLGFWDWSNDAIFVDSYVSYFGSDYGNFVVNPTSQKTNSNALANIVDVNLNPNEVFFSGDKTRVAEEHEYAATWYAGSASTQNTANQVGLMWSPLISGSSPPLAQVTQQAWQTVNAGQQFVLTPASTPNPVTPKFSRVMLTQTAAPEGNVTPTGPSNPIKGVTLEDNGQNEAVFTGQFEESHTAVGFSFTYTFAPGSTDGAQLQIWLNNNPYPYFAMTGSVADGLPGSGTLTATFGLGGEYSGEQDIQIRLVPSQYGSGPPTTVTVSKFQEFSLG